MRFFSLHPSLPCRMLKHSATINWSCTSAHFRSMSQQSPSMQNWAGQDLVIGNSAGTAVQRGTKWCWKAELKFKIVWRNNWLLKLISTSIRKFYLLLPGMKTDQSDLLDFSCSWYWCHHSYGPQVWQAHFFHLTSFLVKERRCIRLISSAMLP